jgi:hypothetical protein
MRGVQVPVPPEKRRCATRHSFCVGWFFLPYSNACNINVINTCSNCNRFWFTLAHPVRDPVPDAWPGGGSTKRKAASQVIQVINGVFSSRQSGVVSEWWLQTGPGWSAGDGARGSRRRASTHSAVWCAICAPRLVPIYGPGLAVWQAVSPPRRHGTASCDK